MRKTPPIQQSSTLNSSTRVRRLPGTAAWRRLCATGGADAISQTGPGGGGGGGGAWGVEAPLGGRVRAGYGGGDSGVVEAMVNRVSHICNDYLTSIILQDVRAFGLIFRYRENLRVTFDRHFQLVT